MKAKHNEALNLLKTARGQLDAIIRMTEESRYCVDIATQIAALESLVRKANLSILQNHIETCLAESFETGDSESKVAEIIHVLRKYIK